MKIIYRLWDNEKLKFMTCNDGVAAGKVIIYVGEYTDGVIIFIRQPE